MKKRMSQRQIEANRRNALRSTGPRTAAGKAAARCNALKHGLRAESLGKVVVEREEECAGYVDLLERFRREFMPMDPEEEGVVRSIVRAIWRLRRYTELESARMTEDFRSWMEFERRMGRYEVHLNKEWRDGVRRLREMQQERGEALRPKSNPESFRGAVHGANVGWPLRCGPGEGRT